MIPGRALDSRGSKNDASGQNNLGICHALGSLFDGPVCEMYPIFVDTPGLFDRRQITGKRLRMPVKWSWG